MTPYGLSQYRLAKSIDVAPRRINEIVHGLRAISADTALRFSKFFGTSPEFWMNLQALYDLRVQQGKLEDVLKAIQPHARNLVGEKY